MSIEENNDSWKIIPSKKNGNLNLNNILDESSILKAESLSSKPIEEIYILSDLIQDGACLRCLSNNCNLSEKHGIFIPDKIKIFIKNPLYIAEIKKAIEAEKISFENSTPIYTTCGFTHSKKGCRNCIDGRMKTINFNKELLTLCYSPVRPGSNKITIGLHIDIKLVLKDKNYQVSAIPVKLILQEKSIESNNFLVEDKDEFPSLSNSDTKYEVPKWNFKKTENLNRNSPLDSTNMEKNIDILDDMLQIPEVESVQMTPEKIILNKEISGTALELKINNGLSESLLKNESAPKSESNEKIIKENRRLRERIIDLEKKIDDLYYEIDRNEFIHKNSEKYEEIIKNLKTLNNKVVEQFFETNYSEYSIY